MWERSAVQYLVLAALVLIQYGQSFRFDYALDDTIVITQNSRVQKGWKDIPSLFSNRYTGKTEDRTGYRPITLLSFATDVQLFGLDPKPSHVINVLLYALACILLLKVLREMFPQWQWLMFLVTVLYTVHPLHTEVVANIKSRDEILAMIFGLLFIRQHVRYFASHRVRHLLIAPVLYVLAVWSKESAITFVGITVAWAFFASEHPWKKRLFSVASSVASFLVIMGSRLYIYSQHFFEDRTEQLKQMGVYNMDGFVGNPMVEVESKVLIMANAMNIFLQSVKMFFVPYPLVHDYSFNHFPVILNFWSSPRVWIGTLLFLAFLVLSVLGLRKRSLITVGAAWFLVTISIYLSIVAPATDIFAERFLFFPSIGLCLLTMGLLQQIPRLGQRHLTTVTVILTVPLLILSTLRVPAWKNSETLLEHDIDKLPNSVRANYNYALYRHKEYNRHPEKQTRQEQEIILRHYNQALRQTDRMDNLYLALGNAYMKFGQTEKGRQTFLEYSIAHPYLSKPFTQLGYYHATNNDLDSAIHYFSKALEVGSINPENYLNLGLAYYNAGRYDEAIETLLKGEQYATSDPMYHRKFVGVCVKTRRLELAEKIIDRGLFLFPKDEVLRDYKQQFEAKKRKLRPDADR